MVLRTRQAPRPLPWLERRLQGHYASALTAAKSAISKRTKSAAPLLFDLYFSRILSLSTGSCPNIIPSFRSANNFANWINISLDYVLCSMVP